MILAELVPMPPGACQGIDIILTKLSQFSHTGSLVQTARAGVGDVEG
jgi:hypothetical protein